MQFQGVTILILLQNTGYSTTYLFLIKLGWAISIK